MDEILSSCFLLSFLRFSIIFCSSSGSCVSKSKKSRGVMLRYSHIKKNAAIDGRAFPVSILFIYPAFCPIDKLIFLVDSPLAVLSLASLTFQESAISADGTLYRSVASTRITVSVRSRGSPTKPAATSDTGRSSTTS